MRSLAAGLLLALMVACATLTQPQGPTQKVYQLHGGYLAGLAIALQYKTLPTCAAIPKQPLCSDPHTLSAIQESDNQAYEALSMAQMMVRSQAPQGAVDAALNKADTMVRRFTGETSQLKVK